MQKLTKEQSAFQAAIIRRLLEGEIEPTAAEAEAKAGGLEPLTFTADASLFDPMSRADWTVPMALAWIADRAVETVLECDNAFRAKCTTFHVRELKRASGETFESWSIDYRSPVTTTMLLVGDAENGDDAITDALSMLREKLGRGIMSSVGMDAGRPVSIPPHEWPYLAPTGLNHDEFTAGSVRYEDVLLRREEILREWPPTLLDWGRIADSHVLPELDQLPIEEKVNKTSSDKPLQEGRGGPSSPVTVRRGLSEADKPLIDEMRSIIAREGIMPWAAAVHVVGKAKGAGTEDSKMRRLVGRYYDLYPLAGHSPEN